MKECTNCRVKMIQIGKEVYVGDSSILKQKGDGFLYKDLYGNIKSYVYVCPKCGLVQQYVPKDELKYLENL